MTRFAYDVSWIVSAYMNARILASTAEGDPGECTPVSFQYLINKLNRDRYTRRALPRSLQDILTVRAVRRVALTLMEALPLPGTQTIGRDSRAGGGGGGAGAIRGASRGAIRGTIGGAIREGVIVPRG